MGGLCRRTGWARAPGSDVEAAPRCQYRRRCQGTALLPQFPRSVQPKSGSEEDVQSHMHIQDHA